MKLKVVKKEKGTRNLDEAVLNALYFTWKSEARLIKMLKSKSMPDVIIAREVRHLMGLRDFLDSAKKTLFKENLL